MPDEPAAEVDVDEEPEGETPGTHVYVSGTVGLDVGTGPSPATPSRPRPARRWRTAFPELALSDIV